jgi:hypothetical protein
VQRQRRLQDSAIASVAAATGCGSASTTTRACKGFTCLIVALRAGCGDIAGQQRCMPTARVNSACNTMIFWRCRAGGEPAGMQRKRAAPGCMRRRGRGHRLRARGRRAFLHPATTEGATQRRTTLCPAVLSECVWPWRGRYSRCFVGSTRRASRQASASPARARASSSGN